MINNEIYCFNELKPINHIFWIITVVILSITFLLFQDSKVTYETRAVVVKDGEKYFLLICVPTDKINYFTDNKYLLIDQKKIQFHIKNIEKELLVINNLNYQNIIIDLDLAKNKQQENLIVEIKIIIKETKVYKKISNILKEGRKI